MPRTYLCIDLKTFYASVECVERGLDPFTTNLVVADPTRTETTICLAISPAMKALGVRNRCRVFEIPEGIEYIMARPRMRKYMEVSSKIYGIYLRYLSPEDIHVYSIDECFMDVTAYLSLYGKTPKEMANMLMDAVMRETGICATAGIGENMFLAKVALDITAKHSPDNIGFLDLREYQRTIWDHRPITDIWNVGPGIAARLAKFRVFDMRGVAMMDPDLLYKEFGVNAEYLIDHAWGLEPCTIAEVQGYESDNTSLGCGQVLMCDYTFDEARIVLREMVDSLVLDLVSKHLVSNHVSLMVGFSRDKSAPADRSGSVFVGEHGARPSSGGRFGPHYNGSHKINERTNSFKKLYGYIDDMYVRNVRPDAKVRRLSISFGGLVPEEFATIDLFTDVEAEEKERRKQQAVLDIKGKFGKNAVLLGTSLKDKATQRERNEQVGGHHA